MRRLRFLTFTIPLAAIAAAAYFMLPADAPLQTERSASEAPVAVDPGQAAPVASKAAYRQAWLDGEDTSVEQQ